METRLQVEKESGDSHYGVVQKVLVLDQYFGNTVQFHNSFMIFRVDIREEMSGNCKERQMLNIRIKIDIIWNYVVSVVRIFPPTYGNSL